MRSGYDFVTLVDTQTDSVPLAASRANTIASEQQDHWVHFAVGDERFSFHLL